MADAAVTLLGNITRDPELRFTNTGRPVATFGMAVNRRWQNRQTNEWEEQTSFFDVTAWADLGEHVVASCHKGDRVAVIGRLQTRTYEQPNPAGEQYEAIKRSAVDVVADEVCPSLRWATAVITKAQRDSANGERQPAMAGAPETPVYADDEEPF